MKCNLKGGSLASNFVGSLLTKRCNVQNSIRTNKTVGSFKNMNLYQTTGGGKRKSRASRKRKSGRSKKSKSKKSKSKSRRRRTMKGGSDWVSVLRSRGPVSYGSTNNKELFRTFTKTGKYYNSQGKLNKRGGGPSTKRRKPSKPKSKPRGNGNSKNSMKELTNTVTRMGSHIARTPMRVANAVKKDATNTALNVTRSAERNMMELEEGLTGVLRQGINKSGTAAKRGMRKGSERIKGLKKMKPKETKK